MAELRIPNPFFGPEHNNNPHRTTSVQEIQERVASADILFMRVRPQSIQFRRNLKRPREALVPIKGTQWPRSVIAQLGSGHINDLMAILKDSALPLEDVAFWRRLFQGAFFDSSLLFPDFWEVWRVLITRYRLYELVAFAQWVIIVGIPNDSAIKTPH